VKTKILFLNPPAQTIILRDQHCSVASKSNYLWPPIDLIVLAGQLSEIEYDITFFDAIAENSSPDQTYQRMTGKTFDWIVSLTCSLTFFEDISFLEKLKQITGGKLGLCGDLAYFYPSEILKRFSSVDFILGDFPSEALVDFLKGHDQNSFVFSRLRTSVEKEIIQKKFQYNSHIFSQLKFSHYGIPMFKGEEFAVILTTTGCPFSCSYCSSRSVPYRERELMNLFEELDEHFERGIRNIWFKDLTFTGNPRRAAQICQHMIDKNYKFEWITETKVETLNPELVSLMAQAGCKTVLLGFDSADPERLCENKRTNDLEKYPGMVKALNDSGIQALIYLMIGWPGETKEQVQAAFKFVGNLKASYVSINYFTPRCGSLYFERHVGSIKDFFERKISLSESSRSQANYSSSSMRNLKWMHLLFMIRFYFNPTRFLRLTKQMRSTKDIWYFSKEGFKYFINTFSDLRIAFKNEKNNCSHSGQER
jgi:radical SAM superfamily enzyme YgiQ (UPF0313 family)